MSLITSLYTALISDGVSGLNPEFLTSPSAVMLNGAQLPERYHTRMDPLFRYSQSYRRILIIIDVLRNFTALRHVSMLMIAGWLFACIRNLQAALKKRLLQRVYYSISIGDKEQAYEWMLVWLSEQSAWAKSSNIALTKSPYGVKWSTLHSLEDDSTLSKLAFFPEGASSSDKSHSCWYRGHYVTITRRESMSRLYDGEFNGRVSSQGLQLSTISWSQNVLHELLCDARKAFITRSATMTSVYAVEKDHYGDIPKWDLVTIGKKRRLDSVILDPALKDFVISDAKGFLGSKQWYAERGTPFRRGYLLSGPPGCGKTSLISAVAGELSLDIYMIALSQKRMDDQKLLACMNALPERCIAVIEDIDVALKSTANRDGPDSYSYTSNEKVSLSGLLNALDGIGAQQGRILFATTNMYESLDRALTRPGRMDVRVQFKLADKFQSRQLFIWFFKPNHASAGDDDDVDADETTDPRVDENDTRSDSAEVPVPVHEQASPIISRTGNHPGASSATFSYALIQSLAEKFASAFPEGRFSMAVLQGYLLEHKDDPHGALNGLAEWVAEEDAIEEERRRKVWRPDANVMSGTGGMGVGMPVILTREEVSDSEAGESYDYVTENLD